MNITEWEIIEFKGGRQYCKTLQNKTTLSRFHADHPLIENGIVNDIFYFWVHKGYFFDIFSCIKYVFSCDSSKYAKNHKKLCDSSIGNIESLLNNVM